MRDVVMRDATVLLTDLNKQEHVQLEYGVPCQQDSTVVRPVKSR
jgi:hypothetical protein